MNVRSLRLARQAALVLALLTLGSAVVVLAVDHQQNVRGADAAAERLRIAEEAARSDPEAAEDLQAIVDQQTAESLERGMRQRTCGVVILVSAGLSLVLLSIRSPASPKVPRCVREAIDRVRRVSDGDVAVSVRTTPVRETDVDLSPIDSMVRDIGREQRHLIPLLHAVHQHYHYLPAPVLDRLGALTGIPAAEITEVASFYAGFRRRPCGKHLIQVCRGTACHVAGADRVLQELRRLLQIPEGEDTDPDRQATIEAVGCLGCCTLAPVVNVDDQLEGYATVPRLPEIVDWNERDRCDGAADPGTASAAVPAEVLHLDDTRQPIEIRVGLGSCCLAGGGRNVMDGLREQIAARRLNAVLKPVGCAGICHLTPLVEIVRPDAEPLVGTRVAESDVGELLDALQHSDSQPQRWRSWVTSLWPPQSGDSKTATESPPSALQICTPDDERLRRFVGSQVRIVTEHCGEMDPGSLEQYREHDGFVALERCLRDLSPDDIIREVEQSGLRGRGGGGFPTGAKWRRVSESEGETFLVCNGDEGDPGAFMDRMVMECYPLRVLEGMAIAALAVGARQAFIYVRHEYPLAVRRLRRAIECLSEGGWLGNSIRGTNFSFHVELVEGAGAFVCGEETALLQSLMGHRGTPRLRPPYPVERGLYDRPTLINNVETYANIPWIIRNGADRFAALGTPGSRGTKVFSLSGKVRCPGLIEIPLGLTIRQVVEKIGGGVGEGKRFKAVQIGGPSGGCVPAELADTPIDYESLKDIGAILGSGGLVVLDDDDCMVDMARYFLEFTQKESCGHCTFCRVGTRKLLDILERLCAGQGNPRDLDDIESLSRSICMGSLCGLGKTAPNPVLSTLRHFREEYEAHLNGHCPAGRCKSLIRYHVSQECVGCTLCAQHCPAGAIPLTPWQQHVIDPDLCTRCDVCRVVCPENAITVV